MKHYLLLMGILLATVTVKAQGIYISRNTTISFYSSAPIEDIKAESKTAVSAMNSQTGEIFFKVLINSFQFRKSLMQEHFNEDYLQSDKYPTAEFKGKIVKGNFDPAKSGTYQTEVQGTLTIHNVAKQYTVPATFDVSRRRIDSKSVFYVKLADHGIRIPRLLTENLADSVQVTVTAQYVPKS